MPDLSGTMRKCRIGTAKNFTLLLLLYITQPNAVENKQLGKANEERLEKLHGNLRKTKNQSGGKSTALIIQDLME